MMATPSSGTNTNGKKHGESMSSPTTDVSLLVRVCIDLRIALYKCYGNIKVIIIIIFLHDNVLFIGNEKL